MRIDTQYLTNPKVLAAGHYAALLHIAAICWAGEHETDGHIPRSALPTLLTQAGVHGAGAKLLAARAVVDAGLWAEKDDGWVLHDFDVMNGSASPGARSRELWRERQRRYRERQKGDGDA